MIIETILFGKGRIQYYRVKIALSIVSLRKQLDQIARETKSKTFQKLKT